MRQSGTRPIEVFARIGRFVAVGWPLVLLVSLTPSPAVVAQTQTQAPAPAPASSPAPTPAPTEGSGRRPGDLTTRYRFIEQYSPTDAPANPQAVAQARVAIRETIKIETDNPRGAPDRKQVVVQTIYTERPAEVGGNGVETSAIRRYDAFRLSPEPPGSKPSEPRPLEGLTIWYQPQPSENPLVLSLSENRRLRENEYSIISRQVFLPDLAAVLPSLPSRIGDRWRIPRTATRALLGERPQPGAVLTATLKDLQPEPKGPNFVATIAVTGQATLPSGASALNAQLQFTFAIPSVNTNAPGGGVGPGVGGSGDSSLDARGAITELRASQVTTAPLPRSNGRLRQTQTRELILARQRDSNAVLTIPNPKPSPTEANSWLTYVEPEKRYHFEHPQTFLPDSLAAGASVELIRPRLEGPDAIGIQLQPKTGNAEADRRNIDPEFHRKTLKEIWRQDRQEVIEGTAEWLPEADWKPAGLRVFRIEAALPIITGRAAAPPRRAYLDYYLILTNRPESFVVTARTIHDPPTDFRKETEAVIKTIRFGPPEGTR